ncbi:MAG: phosphoenolpyruvate hydrolase family protein [Geminicoccaceae bacterium]
MAEVGADIILKLDVYPALIDEGSEAAHEINPKVIILFHGGPVSMPDDAAYILKNTRNSHGFYSLSSMERLPTGIALIEQTKALKATTF